MKPTTTRIALIAALMTASWLTACTQEQQNKISRDIQNWTGTNGVLEVYAGDKLVRRFLKVDKISTAWARMTKRLVPTDTATVCWMKT
jgi:hypothetical protein